MRINDTSKSADTGKSVHLSASAGSGKTRALRDRYLLLLDRLDRSGLGLDQAVAITFTDKAAAEIKERVMRGLPERMLKKIIRGSQELRISTIHSFCMNLLKRYPLEAGLPPDFGVLDARDQAFKIQRAVEDALEESNNNPDIMTVLRDFAADALIADLEFLLTIRSRLKRLEIDAGGPEKLLRIVGAGMGTDQADTELSRLITGPAWRKQFQQMEAILKRLGDRYGESRGNEHLLLSRAENADSAAGISASLAAIYFTSEGNPRKNPFIPKKDFKAGNRVEYENAYAGIQELLFRFRDLYAQVRAGREASVLLRLFLSAEEKYRESKLREGLLDFDDLEIYAYKLLRNAESPDILYWLDRKILHFLVDEFQDTSDIQWAVLDRLTGEIFAGQGADKPMPATLFVVGDMKQSIYRFREANYRLIDSVRKKLEEHLPPEWCEIRTLARNHRSVPEVVETANRIFTKLWEGAYQPSETERTEHAGSVRLIELPPRPPEEDGSAPTEAEVLASEIRKIVDSETAVYVKSPDSPAQEHGVNRWMKRKAGYGDCAVLIQSRTRLKEYEAELRKENIPYRVVGGIGFYEEDEIQAVISVLFFLWNHGDRLSLAAALKSSLFGLADRDLVEIFTGGPDVFAQLRERRPGIGTLLHDWGLMAGVEPLAGLIHRIIRDSGAYIRFGRRNPQAIFNLDKLLDTAREFDRRGYTTLQDFVEWVKNIRGTEQREAAADMNLPGFEGAVSIMTVHKAKGLEFPVVFLPGMNQQPRSVTTGPPAIIESDGMVRMAVKNEGNPVYDDMWQREKEELRREHQRLFYVAMTRARDHLVMIANLNGGRSPVKPDTWLQYFRTAIPAQEITDHAGGGIFVSSHPNWRSASTAFGRISEAEKPATQGQSLTPVDGKIVLENLARLPESKSPEWKKATDFVMDEKEWPIEQPAGQQAGAVSPLVRGSVLHRCLESLATSGSFDLDRISREFPEIESLDDDARKRFFSDANEVLHAVTGSGELAWIFEQRPDAYAEFPFLYRRGRDMVSGVIDRVVVKGNKGFVIDYKAIPVRDEADLRSWKEHYLPQVRIYCEAVKEIFRLDSVEGGLLFLDSAKFETIFRL